MGEPQDSSTWWSELPENFKMEVLAWLPRKCLCRYGGVCRDWNALFSSTQFKTEEWAAAPPNKKPCILLYHRRCPLRFMGYCFFTKTWKTMISGLSFLKGKYPFNTACIHRSAAGLFLVTFRNTPYDRIVCNPLTRTSLKLPSINVAGALSIGIMGGEGHRQATYKVVAVAESNDATQTVEIYDFPSKSWRRAGYLPQNLQASTSELRRSWMVFCEDVLYCLAKALDSQTMGIMAFRIQDGTSIFMPLPQMEVGNGRDRSDHLLCCGSRILIATCIISEASEIVHDIIICEFDKAERIFKLVAKMPRETLSHLAREHDVMSDLFIDFEGIGDLICIKYSYSLEVFVYNLRENSWSRLPPCPIDNGMPSWPRITTMVAFEPRPDMKAE